MTAFQPAVPGPTKDVVVAYVTVTAIGPSRSATPLTISSVNLTNADGKDISALVTSGSVSVN